MFPQFILTSYWFPQVKSDHFPCAQIITHLSYVLLNNSIIPLIDPNNFHVSTSFLVSFILDVLFYPIYETLLLDFNPLYRGACSTRPIEMSINRSKLTSELFVRLPCSFTFISFQFITYTTQLFRPC